MSIPRRFSLSGGWLLALVAIGCSGADASSKRQLDDMRREIHGVQSNNDRLNERVTALELASGPSTDKVTKDPSERPELEVVRLSPDSPSNEPEGDEAGPDDSDPPTVISAEGNQVPSVRRGSKPEKNATNAEAARAYEQALDLVDRKRYDAALEMLSGFLVRYPGHPNADAAMYWRGECYYAKSNYVQAAEQYEGLIARFPSGSKLPDALLKLGLCQLRMGERAKAQETFQKLRKSHPNSDAASKIPRE